MSRVRLCRRGDRMTASGPFLPIGDVRLDGEFRRDSGLVVLTSSSSTQLRHPGLPPWTGVWRNLTKIRREGTADFFPSRAQCSVGLDHL
jgi:hypothetical protein